MIRIAAEPFSRWHAEAAPLFRAHWEEVGTFKDAIALDVDATGIVALERAGMWRAWTVRADAALIGYCCVFVAPSLHYRTHHFAMVDVIYLDPAYRRGRTGLLLIRMMEAGVADVSKIIFHVKIEHDFGRLLARCGYVCTEKNYEKLVRMRAG